MLLLLLSGVSDVVVVVLDEAKTEAQQGKKTSTTVVKPTTLKTAEKRKAHRPTEGAKGTKHLLPKVILDRLPAELGISSRLLEELLLEVLVFPLVALKVTIAVVRLISLGTEKKVAQCNIKTCKIVK